MVYSQSFIFDKKPYLSCFSNSLPSNVFVTLGHLLIANMKVKERRKTAWPTDSTGENIRKERSKLDILLCKMPRMTLWLSKMPHVRQPV